MLPVTVIMTDTQEHFTHLTMTKAKLVLCPRWTAFAS